MTLRRLGFINSIRSTFKWASFSRSRRVKDVTWKRWPVAEQSVEGARREGSSLAMAVSDSAGTVAAALKNPAHSLFSLPPSSLFTSTLYTLGRLSLQDFSQTRTLATLFAQGKAFLQPVW